MRFWIGGPRLFGARTGISFGLQDLKAFRRRPDPAATQALSGGFVYVITSDHGKSKVGVSGDPIKRLAELQTGSPHRLRLAFIGATQSAGFKIEQEAHAILAKQKLATDEWFDVSPELAMSVVLGAAARLREPVAAVLPSQVPAIIAACKSLPAATPARSVWPMAVVAVTGALLCWFWIDALGPDAAPALIGTALALGIVMLAVSKV